MISNNHEVVEIFQKTVLKKIRPQTGLPSFLDFQFYLKLLKEEVQELEDAYNDRNLVKFCDALVDIDYSHKGMVYRSGLKIRKYNRMFLAVHRANLKKVVGIKSERGNLGVSDAVKPPGWVGPEDEIRQILLGGTP